jgi:hypothetical protein
MTVLFIVALAVIVLIALAGGACVALRARRRRRAAYPPRYDWWPQFEEEFRDYVRRSSGRARGTDK